MKVEGVSITFKISKKLSMLCEDYNISEKNATVQKANIPA